MSSILPFSSLSLLSPPSPLPPPQQLENSSSEERPIEREYIVQVTLHSGHHLAIRDRTGMSAILHSSSVKLLLHVIMYSRPIISYHFWAVGVLLVFPLLPFLSPYLPSPNLSLPSPTPPMWAVSMLLLPHGMRKKANNSVIRSHALVWPVLLPRER